MCTYNIMLDDQLVAEAENALTAKGVLLQPWLQQQVENLLREQIGRKCRHARSRSRGLSDEELAERLAQYAPLTETDFPELAAVDYSNYARRASGRIARGLERWL